MKVIDEAFIAATLAAAQDLCCRFGSIAAEDFDHQDLAEQSRVLGALLILAKRGELVSRAGGRFARDITRQMRGFPGQSWRHGIVGPVPLSRMMAAR